MSLDAVRSQHMDQLIQAFGIANAQAVAKDSKAIRAFGMEK